MNPPIVGRKEPLPDSLSYFDTRMGDCRKARSPCFRSRLGQWPGSGPTSPLCRRPVRPPVRTPVRSAGVLPPADRAPAVGQPLVRGTRPLPVPVAQRREALRHIRGRMVVLELPGRHRVHQAAVVQLDQ